MKRAPAVVALALSLAAGTARGEEISPGQTLVLHHGLPVGAPSAMPGGPCHDGRLAFPLPTIAPTQHVVVATTGTRTRGPTIDPEGRIYVGTTSGVTIVSPDGGIGHDVVADALDAAPVLVPGGDVVAVSREGRLVRFAPDGTVRRRAVSGIGVRFAPLVLDDGSLVLVGASRVVMRVGSDLEVEARRDLPDGLALSPTWTARGRVAIATGAELVIASPRTLEIVRVVPLPGRAATPAARAPDGSLWVATVDGDLVRIRGELRADDPIALGARLPEATTSDRAMLAIAPDGDVLVVVPVRGLVRLAPDGTERWAWASDTPLVGALTVDAEGRTAVLDRIGHLSVIDADGASLWTAALESLPLGPAITTAQGRIVVATERGVVILGPT